MSRPRTNVVTILATIAIMVANSYGERPPLTLAASSTGDFSKRFSWHLSVNAAGKAKLWVYQYPKAISREFMVSKRQLTELGEAIDEQKFFDLKAEYGELVPGGSTQTLTVVRGDQANSVKLHYLMNWAEGAHKAKLKEPSRAIRLFRMIREWFSDKNAVNLKKHHEMVLRSSK